MATHPPPSFPLEVTDDEMRCGFRVAKEPSGVQAVVSELPTGLRAVKILSHGAIEYAVCDESLNPLYPPARSLEELKRRFGRP